MWHENHKRTHFLWCPNFVVFSVTGQRAFLNNSLRPKFNDKWDPCSTWKLILWWVVLVHNNILQNSSTNHHNSSVEFRDKKARKGTDSSLFQVTCDPLLLRPPPLVSTSSVCHHRRVAVKPSTTTWSRTAWWQIINGSGFSTPERSYSGEGGVGEQWAVSLQNNIVSIRIDVHRVSTLTGEEEKVKGPNQASNSRRVISFHVSLPALNDCEMGWLGDRWKMINDVFCVYRLCCCGREKPSGFRGRPFKDLWKRKTGTKLFLSSKWNSEWKSWQWVFKCSRKKYSEGLARGQMNESTINATRKRQKWIVKFRTCLTDCHKSHLSSTSTLHEEFAVENGKRDTSPTFALLLANTEREESEFHLLHLNQRIKTRRIIIMTCKTKICSCPSSRAHKRMSKWN